VQTRIGVGPQHAYPFNILLGKPSALRLDDAFARQVAQIAGDNLESMPARYGVTGKFIVASAARLVRRDESLMNQ
jgi:hypothetical protein